jgi:hypothetical protein
MTSQNIIHLSYRNNIYLLAKKYIKNKFIHISIDIDDEMIK